MNGITFPNESLAVSIRRIENRLELFDSFLGTAQAEDAFNTSSWGWVLAIDQYCMNRLAPIFVRRTLFLQEDTAFSDYNRNIAVNVALSILVNKRDGNVCVCYALSERNTKYASAATVVYRFRRLV